MPRRPGHGALGAALLALAWISCAPGQPVAQTTTASRFAAEVAALSEPGGFFDTDNLISNERSYLHAVSDLDQARVRRRLSRRRRNKFLISPPSGPTSYHRRPATTCCSTCSSRPSSRSLRRGPTISVLFDGQGHAAGRQRIDRRARRSSGSRRTAGARSARIFTRIDRNQNERRAAVNRRPPTIDRFHRQFIDGGLSCSFTARAAPQFGYPRT